ncbi:MAG: hypothetical protein M1813_006978 [Trichoglossum hirsutum]|nr:MAG: hypothetical protein M1813_006978 [Trichoglossum hirsutum]
MSHVELNDPLSARADSHQYLYHPIQIARPTASIFPVAHGLECFDHMAEATGKRLFVLVVLGGSWVSFDDSMAFWRMRSRNAAVRCAVAPPEKAVFVLGAPLREWCWSSPIGRRGI